MVVHVLALFFTPPCTVAQMPTPAPHEPKRDSKRFILGRTLTGLCAFGVFFCGWMAMRATDWRQMVLWTVIAAGCGWFASRFATWGR